MSSDDPFSQTSGYSQAPMQPPPPQRSGANTGLIIGIVALVVAIPVMLACAGILLGLLLPAIQAGREAARRMQCSNNMKQIGLALHNYHDDYKTFPPAYTVDASDQRLHSWRTLILPYLEQQALYDQIDLSKPWDDPVNQQIAAMQLPVYSCPSTVVDPEMTTYVAVVDPAGVFAGAQGVKMQSVVDGTSNTLMVVETSPDNAVPWMSPNDIDMQTFVTAGNQFHAHPGGAHATFCDGSVQFLSETMDQQVRREAVTRNGAEESSGF